MTATSQKTYVLVWAGLLLLLAATLALAEINLKPFNAVIALGISAVKAVLIVLYFMHVRHSSRLTWVFAGAGFVWFTILIALTLTDYLTR